MSKVSFLLIFILLSVLFGTPCPSIADEIIQGRLEHMLGEDSSGQTVADQYFLRNSEGKRIAVRFSNLPQAESLAIDSRGISLRITPPDD